jgi:RNA polymerase sigma-70 factor (ECF subfamily)
MDHPGQDRPTEQALVDRLCRGDETALGDLYDRYAGFVHGLALRVLRDRGSAEDVTQDVFVSMWEDPQRFDAARGTLRGYLGTLTHRRSVDLVRREEARRRREARTSMEPRAHPDLADAALQSVDSQRVRAAVAVLPPAQRKALELAYFQGRTYRQVADELGIPEGTAKSRLRLGLQRIAELLRPELSEQWA